MLDLVGNPEDWFSHTEAHLFFAHFRRTGTALTLLTRGDWRNAKDLIGIMVEANQVMNTFLLIVFEKDFSSFIDV